MGSCRIRRWVIYYHDLICWSFAGCLQSCYTLSPSFSHCIFSLVFGTIDAICKDMNLAGTGIPKRDQIISNYCECSQHHYQTLNQRQPPPQSLSSHPASYGEAKAWAGFYLAFLFFKNCVIVHGVAQRASSGVASSASASRVAKLLPNMVRLTWKIWGEYPPPTNNLGAISKL